MTLFPCFLSGTTHRLEHRLKQIGLFPENQTTNIGQWLAKNNLDSICWFLDIKLSKSKVTIYSIGVEYLMAKYLYSKVRYEIRLIPLKQSIKLVKPMKISKSVPNFPKYSSSSPLCSPISIKCYSWNFLKDHFDLTEDIIFQI